MDFEAERIRYMKTLYLECNMGAAGDMLTAALLELHDDPEGFVERFNKIGIPGVEMRKEQAEKCGIHGTHINIFVNGEEEGEEMHDHEHHHDHDHEHHHDHDNEHHHDHDHEHYDHDHEHHDHDHEHHHDHDDHDHEHHHHHHHTSMHDVESIIGNLDIPEKVKEDVIAVYGLIAEAESKAHNKPVTEIHFHEVGTMDAIADVTAVCMLMNEIAPQRVVASPIHVGSGSVHCAHGILPVPAPATAHILKDVPMYGGSIKGELCTPTGAALIKYFADSFGEMPIMQTKAIGYGMGKKDFPVANCVRSFIGESENSTDKIIDLSCNIDDMTAEEISFACESIMKKGARDVFTVPIQMKKGRPGILLHVITDTEKCELMVNQIFKHTTTLGIRKNVMERYTLSRRFEEIDTPYGKVNKKISSGYGSTTCKVEYEDLAEIARKNDISLREARALIHGFKA